MIIFYLMELFLKFLLISFLIGSIIWFVLQGPVLIKLRKIPGPTPLPIVGNLHQLTFSTDKFMPSLMEMGKKHGKILKLFLGFVDVSVVVAEPKFLELLLGTSKELNKSTIYKLFSKWVGNGLLTSRAEKWKKQRKMITPAFHFKILEKYLEIFQKNDEIFIEKLQNELHGNTFDIYQYVVLLSLDNIVESAMNTSVKAQENVSSDYVESTRKMAQVFLKRQFSLMNTFEFLYRMTDSYSEEQKHLKILHGFTKNVIQQRKQEKLNNPNKLKKLEDEGTGIRNKVAFLDLLLESTIDGRPLTDQELRDEVETFLFEGHDTTASAISFVFYCLSKHPEKQKKLMKEIHSVFGEDKERKATYSELQNMKYLEAFIKETLRLYPSVPLIGRIVTNNFEYDGIKFPKNTSIEIFIYKLLRDPDIFENAETFNPDRFLGKWEKHPYAYIPFSAGPRNCIGQKYAMVETKSTVVNFLRHYEIMEATNAKLVLSFESVLKSTTGINIRIKRRI